MDSYSYSAESLLLLVAASTTKKPPAQPVNINSADSTQLQLVRGIGPSTVEKILQMRKSYGAFKSVNDLTVGKAAPSAPNTAQPASAKTKPHASKSAPTKSVDTQNAPPPRPSTEQPAPETEEP